MTEFKDARMDTLYYEADEADVNWPCKVRFDGKQLVIQYEEENEIVTYQGAEHGDGHYVVTNFGEGCRATLHRFPDSPILEGFWADSSYRGMWRIVVAE